MKRRVFIYSLMLVCLATGGVAYGQTQAPKACPFNIVGTWKSEASTGSPIFFRFAPDGTVTLLSSSTDIPDSDFEVLAAVKYELDKPSAPKRLDIIAERGNEVFGRGTTSLTVTEFSDDSFTTVNPITHAGLTRWVRAKTNRYFLTFAARGVPVTGFSDDNSTTIHPERGRHTQTTYGGPAFAIWTKLDGRRTEVDTLGIHLVTDRTGLVVPTMGTIPAALHKEFLNESRKESDVMIRFELTEAEYVRTHKVFKTWEKRVQNKTLLYDDPYLNAMEFLRRTAESLNQCGEKVNLHKLTWHTNDKIVTQYNVPQHPLEYIRDMRKKNDQLHVTDERFPTNWRPTQF
ncbi:MAG TPA: hypothetical protein VGV59_05495 [Pyrinomonadaceae bacterium]|nr:hypothetical protein [Pyrinomonadaceae bacterium]